MYESIRNPGPRNKWGDNIKILVAIKEEAYGVAKWNRMSQDRKVW